MCLGHALEAPCPSYTAHQFLTAYLRGICGAFLPLSTEKPCQVPSNSEIRRWLEKGSVTINGQKPQPNDLIAWPVWELTFFKGAKRQCSYAWSER